MRILIVYTNRVARLEGLAADLQRALCFEDRLRETRAGRCSPSVIISGTIHPLTRRTFNDLRSLLPPPLFATRGYQRLHLPMLSPRPPHSLELSEQLSLASFEDWTWKRFAVFNGEETPVVTLERAPLLNLLLYSLFLSLWDINLINSSVHTFHIRVFNNARSKSILADSSNNSG